MKVGATFRLLALGSLIAGHLIVQSSTASAAELRARLGNNARFEMRVLGVDAEGLRLRPADGGEGEVIVPLSEARDLLFIFPQTYSDAQKAAFNGRPTEALRLLAPIIPPLLPYLRAPSTNAVPAVRYYFDLLLAEQQWDDALALARELPLDVPETDFLPKAVQLARALRSVGRTMDATSLVNRIPIKAETREYFGLLDSFGDELRRNGNYTEAQLIYERLQPFDEEAAATQRALTIAYTVYHQGSPLRAAAMLDLIAEPATGSPIFPLYLLMRGRVALEDQRPADALDQFSRGLVVALGASEWRAELLAATAAAYRAAGSAGIAMTIESDMRRIYPESRWTPPAESDVETRS